MSATSPPGARARRLVGALGVPLLVLIPLGLLSLFCLVYELRVTVLPSLRGGILDGIGPDIVTLLAGLLLIARGRARRAWGLIGLGAVCWAAGDIYWTLDLAKLNNPPVPSWADAGYLSFCPLAIVGVVGLVRPRLRSRRAAATLIADAATAALAIGALSAALVFQPIMAHASGGAAAIATNLAYPLVDVLLLGLIVGATALGSWKLERRWVLLAAGVISFWVADSMYLIANAQGTYQLADWYNPLWYFAPVLFAWAAWLPEPARRPQTATDEADARSIVMPLAFVCVALGTVICSKPSGVYIPQIVLGSASILVAMGRLALTWRENAALLRASRTEALTDTLTQLSNRRALIIELQRRMEDPDHHPYLLVMFDLDGFKYYNDQFGHLAGDTLLRRLGRKFDTELAGRGRAYRMGGDEFCAIIDQPQASGSCVKSAAEALSESGEGFDIGCSFGSVVLPEEATTTEQALRMADHRMYAHKRSGRASASRQSKDVLMRVLGESDPDLSHHVHNVADLAATVAAAYELSGEEIEQIRQAAELHDIGKVAIPDAILGKPGPLTESEWKFIRSHTMIGERILDAAPALRPVARLVRSSHENFDGSGYPDRLSGHEIPLGSRIIAVCDAFAAMTTDRPYRQAVDHWAATAELQRCAGSQFDPDVVARFGAAVSARDPAAYA